MKIFGLTITEWVGITVILGFLAKQGYNAFVLLKAAAKRFVEEQVGGVYIAIKELKENLAQITERLTALENHAGAEGSVCEQLKTASEQLTKAAGENVNTLKTLQEIAVKFSAEKPQDFGKVIHKE